MRDTNDPAAYIALGRAWMRSSKDSLRALAESAFVLAGRLDPASGQPPYLLAVATLWTAYETVMKGWGERAAMSQLTKERRARIDSLMHEAWLREPFFDLELEPLLTLGPLPAPAWGRNRVQKAYLAYQHRDYALALALWRQEIARKPERLDLRFHRAHTFYLMARFDSAIVELRAALTAMTPPDTGIMILLPRTDVLHYALGVVYERAGEPDSAREAYQRALLANLGIYMAHARLSNIRLADGDTAGAVQEVVVALDAAPREALLIAHYGSVLLRIGRFQEGVEWLAVAESLNPRHAAPYFLTGMGYDHLERTPDALKSFESFLSRASQRDPLRPAAVEHISRLRTSLREVVKPRE